MSGAPAPGSFAEGVAAALAEDGGTLLAEDVLGGVGRIDWVARLAGGRVAVVIDARGDPLAALGRVLSERAWLAPRVADWARLAPERGLRPERGVGALLVGERLHEDVHSAAAEAGVEMLELVRVDGRWLRPDPGPAHRVPGLRSPRPAAAEATLPPAGPGTPPAPLRSVFRSGLRP